MKTSILTFWACLLLTPLMAQQPDSTKVDTKRRAAQFTPGVPAADSLTRAANADVVPDSLKEKPSRKSRFGQKLLGKKYPNPRAAALFSAVLPGAGQAYNRKWWKVPIAWGALGTIGYFTFDTQKTYRELRDSYVLLVDGDPNTNPTEEPYSTFDATRTKQYRDTFRGYTEKWYLALGVTYLLIVTDAFVDAHLYKFDVSDDLSLQLRPSFETSNGAPVFGMGIALSLSNKPLVRP
ncbi:MAG TPA: DUF5683 domain-containing protein [Saprospiraceae bacterium]|nr:DUF5683 domain-containing protein [Saprospiraceae bacterium]